MEADNKISEISKDIASKFISRSLIIGLGGTGQNIIKELRKRILERYGEFPRLIDFLSIDTTLMDFDSANHTYTYNREVFSNQKYNVDKEDFTRLMVGNIASYLSENNRTYKFVNKEAVSKLSSLMSNKGANGFRVLGKMYLLINHPEVLKIIKAKIENIRNIEESDKTAVEGYKTASKDISVFIVGSIAGGTCSGAFLDLAQLVNIAFGEGHNDNTFGIFMFPAFFEDKPNTENKYINGYAALSELDYILEPGNINPNDPKIVNHFDNHDYPIDKKLFQNVFLIDNKTSNDLSLTVNEAVSYVSSFIANSICVPADRIQESFVNNTHCNHTHKKRRRNYSSLSFLEIYFDRESFRNYLLDYLVDKKIESFLIPDSRQEILKKAQDFITNNSLDEGREADIAAKKNDLIDNIIKLEDQIFVSLIIGSVDTGSDASTKVVEEKDKLINKLKETVSSQLKKFESTKGDIIKMMESSLEEIMYSQGFITNIPLFVDYLREDFVAMSKLLESEITLHKKTIDSIEKELNNISKRIKENSRKGFAGIGSKLDLQEKEIKNYQSLVSGKNRSADDLSNTNLKLQILQLQRKEAGVSFYNILINKLNEFYRTSMDKKRNTVIEGRFVEMRELYYKYKSVINLSVASYKPVEIDKFRINLHAFLKKEININHKALNWEKNESNTPDIPIEELFKLKVKEINVEKVIEDFKIKIENNIPSHAFISRLKFGKLLPIDDVFLYFYGDGKDIDNAAQLEKFPQLKVFEAVQNKMCFLWKHKNISTENTDPDENSGASVALTPQQVNIIGVYNTDKHIFDGNHKYKTLLNFNFHTTTANNDPDKIFIIGLESAIAAFHIESTEIMYKDFLARQEVYCSTDTRLEPNLIQMIVPDPVNLKADEAWAYGWLLGLIVNKDKRIKLLITDRKFAADNSIDIDSEGYYDYFAIKKQRSSDLAVCRKAFSQNTLLVEYFDKECLKLREVDLEDTKNKIMHWINDKKIWDEEIRGKKEISMTPAEKKVIIEEISTLIKSFEKLNSRGRRIGIDSNNKIIIS
jgi:hypothetical protein